MSEDRGPRSSEDRMEDAIGRVAPDSIDGRLVHRDLMAEMFGREIEGPRFGRFELRDRIGAGGMGVVYRAWDPQLEREVAIKVIDTARVGDTLRERALAEARSLAKLAHPNVITVFESGLDGRRVWIAMELVQGTTLHEWLARVPRPDDATILAHWIAVARGLLAAHRLGLVHRDVKPSNVLIGDDGRARLIDFGLVHGVVAPAAEGFVGTYRYAAPEQREGGAVDAAVDQYSLCACIWEALCGQLPSASDDGASLPSALRRVLQRGLSERAADRFPSLAELISAIEAATTRRARTSWWIAAGLVVIAGAAAAAWRFASVPCAIDATALDGTWDDARRAALRERFGEEDGAYTATTLATVERGIDDWAQRWHDARREACRATHVHGTETASMLALRQECLERRRRSLQVTLATWSTNDATIDLPANAPALLERLPELATCSDAASLGDTEPLPEGAAREAVLAAYDRLSEARALASAGAPERAEAIVATLEASATEAIAYAPLRLAVQALPAQLDIERARIVRAVPRLVELSREAEARHLDTFAAELRVEAAVAAAGHWSGSTHERFLVDEAETAVRRLARTREPLRPSLLHARASLLLQDGELEQALAGFREAQTQALALEDDAFAERESWHIAATLGELGRYDEAQVLLEEGRTHAQERWGADAPLIGSFELDLAVLALETGRLDVVDAHLDRAEAIYAAAFGAASFRVARVHYARAKARMTAGEFAKALALVDDAFAVYVRELGADHEVLAELHEARGVLRFFTGDLEGSIASYRAALDVARATVGADDASVARLHSNLGESQAALGRLDQARASFAEALEIYARTLPADHPELALPLKGRGQVELATGHAAQAVEDLERALALQLRTGAEPLEIADIRFSLARALAAAAGTRSPRARELALQARDDFTRLQVPERVDIVNAWLGG